VFPFKEPVMPGHVTTDGDDGKRRYQAEKTPNR
jgi:hypothetical protein